MDQQTVIAKTKLHLEELFKAESSGHDYWHMIRVWELAKHIGSKESGVDMFTLELAALLHDIADWKFHDGDEEAGPRAARQWLSSLDVPEGIILHIEDIIRNISFKGANVASKLTTAEGKIVHDADKLDAMGAIGIARTFAYGGMKNRPMYNPAVKPVMHDTFEAYRKSSSPSINHFYEKLLLLKNRMFTDTGKRMAEHRHEVMERYLAEFYAEWDGER